MDKWMMDSKYYIPWDRYVEMHPELDERNLEAMKDRYEKSMDKMFSQVMTFLF